MSTVNGEQSTDTSYTLPVAEELPKPLRDDVRLLGEVLGETLRRQENHALYETVERCGRWRRVRVAATRLTSTR